ncbi:MAG TPA: protein translocase subunit SecF [Gammaproteobacteria bacterium]|nr:protein translocase subunit SecF [Gammaproteobacteria bacterium]
MQWLTGTPNINFMKYRRAALIASAALTVVALLSIVVRGLNLGIDFTGGINVEAGYSQEADLEAIRSELAAAGFDTAQVQAFGSASEVLIRLPPLAETEDLAAARERILAILRGQEPTVVLRNVATVDPQVGEELTEQGGLAMLFALIMIFIYVMLRFRWKLAIGAIVATVHDVVVTVGFFSVFGLQFDLIVLGSVLAVLGYSLNDTIVVYDRIRDNFRLVRRGTPESIVNLSINQTLARTLVTGVTTLLVLFALLIFAGDTLWGFSIALIVGIVIGTYSSIYVASAMALLLKVTPTDLVAAKQEKVDELP